MDVALRQKSNERKRCSFGDVLISTTINERAADVLLWGDLFTHGLCHAVRREAAMQQ